jgi:outer membrane protein assembly factor BamA
MEINAVKLPVIDPGFAQKLDTTTYLAYSYKDVLITALNYSYIYNNQNIKKVSDFIFLRLNVESAGNSLSGLLNLSNREKENENYSIIGLEYAQYLKADIDFRYHHYINKTDQLVYRAFLGVGYPYGNSQAMPFEKQYFSGGANGIRAWNVRALGPGSYDPGDITFYNQTADIKFETNLEYRFKLFWILEGALFLDAGNIWSIRQEDERPGSVFQWDKFYDDIALGTGFGARFDFSFFIFRLDLGMKLRDPSIYNSNKWVMANGGVSFKDDFTLHLGIGYPF